MNVLLNRKEDYYYGVLNTCTTSSDCENAAVDGTNSIVGHDDDDDDRYNGRSGLVAGAPGTTANTLVDKSGSNTGSECVNRSDVNVDKANIIHTGGGEKTGGSYGSTTFSGNESMVCDGSDNSSSDGW